MLTEFEGRQQVVQVQRSMQENEKPLWLHFDRASDADLWAHKLRMVANKHHEVGHAGGLGFSSNVSTARSPSTTVRRNSKLLLSASTKLFQSPGV